MDLKSMARALGGDVVGWEVLCPGPGHSPQDRSLSVKIDDQSSGLFVVYSFSNDDFRACRDYISERLGIATAYRRTTKPSLRAAKGVDPSNASRTARAMAVWHEAEKLDGSPAATYLFHRGIDASALPRDLHRALRWHPVCPWERIRHGCMLGLFTDAVSGDPKAIHRTAITPSGDKVGRKALGPVAGCVIRLWPDEMVELGLVVGEGIETTLAAATRIEHKGTLLQPAWAAGFAGNLGKLAVLSGVGALTLLVDHDESGAGQRAAQACSARWTAAGREVTRLVPRLAGTDFNDLLEEL